MCVVLTVEEQVGHHVRLGCFRIGSRNFPTLLSRPRLSSILLLWRANVIIGQRSRARVNMNDSVDRFRGKKSRLSVNTKRAILSKNWGIFRDQSSDFVSGIFFAKITIQIQTNTSIL